MVKDYGLSFISNEDLFLHVKAAIDSDGERSSFELKNNGSFHQNLLKSAETKRQCLSKELDVISNKKKIFAEIRSKCPSMNSSSGRDTYMQMQHKILCDRSTTCYLVEVSSKFSHDSLWKITLDGQTLYHENIRRISLDKFYQQVTGIRDSFSELCQVLPKVFDDILKNTVLANR